MKIFFIVLLLISLHTYSAPYTPKYGDEIIASWAVPATNELQSVKAAARLAPNDPTAIVALANAYLLQAEQPGQSRLYGLAQAALKPLIDKNTQDYNVWLVWAQIQQHQHNFTAAQEAIAKVLERDPANENAHLLAARIYVVQDNPSAARNSCLKLLGSADLLTVSACSLEANSYLNPNDLDNTYRQLASLVQRNGLPTDERATWLIQLLAELALRNNDPVTAADWLAKKLTNASVNYLAQWADVQLALNNPKLVLTHLTPIVYAAPEMDDALLLKLAISEKNIAAGNNIGAENIDVENTSTLQNKDKNNAKKQQHWQKQLAERVALREQRQDSLHASELATYYLDIAPNPAKALHWAQINIAHTREYSDKNLLARAQQFNQAPSTQSGIQ